jgi:hypothetical protein
MLRITRSLNVNVSDLSYDGWNSFAANHGAPVAALIEIIGLQLGEIAAGTPPPEPARLELLISRARHVAEVRRRRRQPAKRAAE